MKKLITILFFLTIGNTLAQNFLTDALYNDYPGFKERSLHNRNVKHNEIEPLILKLKHNNLFKVKNLGKSLEGRNIYLVSLGNGPVNVLAWSQMHGDEPTATKALFDIFNFFTADDNFNGLKKELLSRLTLHFIPMLNPDGAEVFKRRNALSIDLNRDAERVEFPEAKILKAVRDSLKPKFGFNLHDQNPRYSVGKSHRTATISFLAPAFNYNNTIDSTRENTMKVIADLFKQLSEIIPGHMARYNDDFEPRAFGDNFVKWGTSSILIESGGWKSDEQKEFIRKLNFIALITAFNSIASGNYENYDVEDYKKIPENDKLIFNLLLRNLKFKYNDQFFKLDIGINREEKYSPADNKIFYEGKIDDIGDLSIFYGNEEIDCTNMEVVPGKIYDHVFNGLDELKKTDLTGLLSEGFTSVKVKDAGKELKFTGLPVNIITADKNINHNLKVDNNANFIIKKNGKTIFAVVNGFLFNLKTMTNNVLNALVY